MPDLRPELPPRAAGHGDAHEQLVLDLALARSSLSLSLRFSATPGVLALFGPSGSGKTTCLRLIAGLERGRGVLRMGDEVWQDDSRGVFVPVHHRPIGYVFQEPSLFSHLSVADNLAYGARRRAQRHVTPGWSKEAVLETLRLGPLLARRAPSLSGGERQRVALGRALLASPRWLLLDEPLAALDGDSKAEILSYLELVRDRFQIPMIYVSHAFEEVARLADEIVMLEGGRVRAFGALPEVLSRLDLASVLAEEAGVVLEGHITAHDEHDELSQLQVDGGSLWVAKVAAPLGGKARARVRARDVSLALARPGPSSVLNCLPARVLASADDGPGRVTVRLALGESGAPLLARITRRSHAALGLVPGQDVFALVKSVALFR